MSYLMSQFISLNLNSSKSIANGDSMPLVGIGSIDTPSVALSDVYYILNLTMNLASVTKFVIRDMVKFFLDIHGTASFSVDLSSFWLNHSSSTFYLWYSQLGHVSGSRLRFLASSGVLGKLDAHDIFDCSGYKLAKFLALPFSNSISSSTSPFDLVHSDVWGPSFGETVLIATYVINRIPTAHNSGLSPFEKLYGTPPDYSLLCVFGCTCFVLKPHVERTKLSVKSTLCVFLGYGVSQKGYRCYDPTSIVTQPPTTTQSSSEVAAVPPANVQPTCIRKSTRKDDFVYSSLFSLFIASVHRLHELESYREAVCDPLWQVAMAEELVALHHTQTWDLVPFPIDKRAIGSHWVYKIKTRFGRSIERYKARLVAKGYGQEYSMDYEETFTPVTKMTTVRTLIAISSSRKWKIFQLDDKNAFLNGDLNEEVFMKPPPGVFHKPGEVCKLRKSLYGLKQAPRAWYEKFATVVTSFGFVSSHHDSALFVNKSSARRILLSLYVDDMIITGDDCVGIESLKLELAHRFPMKDLGLLCYFMGIEVASSPEGYILSQSKYICDLLDPKRITNKMVEDIPIDAKAKYTPKNGDPLPDPSLYRTIVGSLVYLTVTRPDISYVVHIVNQFVSAPTTVHWVVVLHILIYLRGT
ncbi:retrovirus-related pol polyprotein from transposon TNT 1-94 [Tanacetum coccineum]